MILKANDKVYRLYSLVGAGLLTADDLNDLIANAKKIQPFNFLELSFDQFSTIAELRTDIEIVEYISKLNKQKIKLPKRGAMFLNLSDYLELLKFVKESMNDISNAIEQIKQPEMSAEMRGAGFHLLNFGDLGVARLVGEFEGVGTVEAYSLPMHLIIRSLEQSAAIKRCEKNHAEIMKSKSEIKKYR